MNIVKRSKKWFSVFTTIPIYLSFFMSMIYAEFDPYIDHGGTVLGIICNMMNE